MKKTFAVVGLVFMAVAQSVAQNASQQVKETLVLPSAPWGFQAKYACPMECVTAQTDPGNCPVCSMPLVPIAKGPHGGVIQSAEGIQIEAALTHEGIRVFAYDDQGNPLDTSDARGVAVLQIDGDAKRYRYDLFPDVAPSGNAESLAAAVDLRRLAGATVKIELQLVGLPGAPAKPLQTVVEIEAPKTKEQLVAAAIAEQKVCPVSGEPLGSMGEPIAVPVGERAVYVCCQGCVAAVQAEPAKYLAMVGNTTGTVPPGDREVRPGVFKVSVEDQPYIAAQQKCPVMDEPLGGMGDPLKVHADGKAIYICCAGCAKKIAAEPVKYLQALEQQGVTPPSLRSGDDDQTVPPDGEEVRPGVFKVTEADRRFIDSQKTCPVMDEPLDGMGGPYRVVVEGRAVYICCPGCAKKLQADPKVYLDKLAEQGIEAPAVR